MTNTNDRCESQLAFESLIVAVSASVLPSNVHVVRVAAQ
jgi:hypothetical protein